MTSLFQTETPAKWQAMHSVAGHEKTFVDLHDDEVHMQVMINTEQVNVSKKKTEKKITFAIK